METLQEGLKDLEHAAVSVLQGLILQVPPHSILLLSNFLRESGVIALMKISLNRQSSLTSAAYCGR